VDIISLLNVKALAAALTVTLGLLGIGGLIGRRVGNSAHWPMAGGAVMPVALAAGFLAGYAMQFPFPQGNADRPWYLDEAWKMASVVALGTGILLAVAHMVPKPLSVAVVVLLLAGVASISVRGPWLATEQRPAWEAYAPLAGALLVSMIAYILCLWPTWWDPRLWILGPLVMWACLAVAGVLVMTWVDQRLGRLLVMLAVLAGLAGVSGMPRPMRAIAAGAGPFLSVMFSVLVMLAYFYCQQNEVPALSNEVWLLLACAPLGAAVAWVPALRRRPWLCVLVAIGVTGAFLAATTTLAIRTAPPPMG
jgi:hypothetical protein